MDEFCFFAVRGVGAELVFVGVVAAFEATAFDELGGHTFLARARFNTHILPYIPYLLCILDNYQRVAFGQGIKQIGQGYDQKSKEGNYTVQVRVPVVRNGGKDTELMQKSIRQY
jgi:hypothetical protein